MVETGTTKDRLADAFRTCLEEAGYSKTKVSTVARMCNVDRQTFYYWFKDIEDVLRFLYRREFHPDREEGFWPDDLAQGRMLFLDLAERNRSLVNTVLASPVRDEAIMAWFELMVWGYGRRFDAMTGQIADKRLQRNLEPEKGYFTTTMSVSTIALDECWIRGGMFDVSKENLVEMELRVADDCLQGILARHTQAAL
ncbi:MAG: TetR/AcrR family transcriptional regulator [Coriobacteriaceae bacterium]|jgi:AcrR family transcriptional regulator|nr:TetR/AcrR family transcriptional regulator [Coriobacteriaceae bacterium]